MGFLRVGFVVVALVVSGSGAVAQESTIQLDAIQQSIREAEYRVTWQDQTFLPDLDAAWHATNRAQNLRFYITGKVLWVLDRTAEGSPELARLEVEHRFCKSQLPAVFEPGGNELAVRSGGLTQRFVNTAKGLEHHLVINEPAAGGGPSVSELNWSAAGLTLRPHAVELSAAAGRHLIYAMVEAFDATGATIEAAFSLRDDRLVINFGDNDSVYPVTVKNLLTGTANTVLQGNLDDLYLGSDVASGDLNGDGFADVVATVPGWDGGQINEGALAIFHGGPGGIASNGTGAITSSAATVIEGNVDGYLWPKSIDIVGDINGDGFEDLVAGDDWWDPDFATYPPQGLSRNFGAVWFFNGSASGITASDPDGADSRVVSNVSGANLGASVAGAGDVNGDGFADLIAGAPLWSDSGSQAVEGAAFVFHGSSTGITAADIGGAATILEGNQALLRAGESLAGVGDLDGDGFDDVAVGLPLLSRPEANEGGVAVLYGSATGISGNPTLPLADRADTLIQGNESNAEFGNSIAERTDVNGDGLSDLAAGAWWWSDEPGQVGEGALLVFHGNPSRIDSNPTSAAIDVADTVIEGNSSTPFYSMYLGFQVAGAIDLNGDGYGDLVATAKGFSNPEVDEGGVFVFFGRDGGIPSSRVSRVEEAADLVIEGNTLGLYLGESGPGAGDVNGDGFSDLVLSIHGYSAMQTNEGAVFIYHGGTRMPANEPDGQYVAQQSGEGLGESCNSAGDLNGDGYVDFVAGAPWFDSGGHTVGRIDVFYGSAGPFLSIPDWTIIGEPSGDWLGWSQASAGDVNGDGYGDLVVGLPAFSNGQPADGQVHVYYGSSSGLSSEADWSFESTDSEAELGKRVAAAGDVNGDGFGDLMVGAPGYANGQTAEGRIYLFLGSSEGLSDSPDWTFESDFVNAMLGAAVAGVGDVNGDRFADVIAGAPGYANGNYEEGAAYGFLGSATGLPAVPNWFIQSNRDYSNYGFSTAGIGDVNGDGFDDVAVGVPDDSNPEISEGRVYLYHGSPTGSSTVADRVLERNQANSSFGWSVAGAGDINGDGFADVIVGAPEYPSAALSLGRAELFLGSSTGVAELPAWSIVGTAGPEAVGRTVAGGDHNGDGFSDIAVGAPFSDTGFPDSGAVELYLGNGGAGRPVLARQFRGADDPTPVQPWGLTHSGDEFQVSVTATSPRGRELAKLHVEACPPDEGWGDVDCRHAVSDAWTAIPLGEEGAVLTETISSLTDGELYRWRAHVLYLPLHADEPGITEPPVPRHGPWRRLFALAPAADIRIGVPQAITIELVGTSSAVDEGAPLAEVGLVMTTSDGEVSTLDSSVDFGTFDMTAVAGEDYVHTSFNRFFPAGTASGTAQAIEVNLINDDLDEPEEDFAVELYNPMGAVVGEQNTHTVTIADDDPPPELSSATVEVDEDAGVAIVTLELSAPTSFEVTVNYSTDDGTATAPEDYLAASGTAIIPPMDTTATIELIIEEDWLEEGDEVFTLELSGTSKATLMTPMVEVIIHDNDSGIIFADGFESGNTSAWSSTKP